MRWSDLDGDWWTIPAERTKIGRQHRVFLSPLARGVIDELRPLTGDLSWVLASSRRADQPVTARAYNRYNYDAEIRDALALWGERLGAIISGNDLAELLSIA